MSSVFRDLREQRYLTQEEVSKRTGIPYDSYRRYEYGKSFPKSDAIISLAHLFGMSPGELFNLLIGWDTHACTDGIMAAERFGMVKTE